MSFLVFCLIFPGVILDNIQDDQHLQGDGPEPAFSECAHLQRKQLLRAGGGIDGGHLCLTGFSIFIPGRSWISITACR